MKRRKIKKFNSRSYNSAETDQAREHKLLNAKVRILKSMECLIEFSTMHVKWGKCGNRQIWNE